MKQRALRFSHLVDLQSIPGLERITDNDDGLSIGALATHRSVERSPLVQRRAPALAQAFSHVGNVRIRETASVGGNLAHADYRLDPPPVLLVHGAEGALAGAEGTRVGALKDFYRGMYEGEPCSEELWDAVCETVDEQISPVSDLRGSVDYKREMTRVWVKRTLRELSA